MTDLLEVVEDVLAQGRPAVIATIVHTRGSTPREVGARMIVEDSGKVVGTVGGGCGEAEVWSEAMKVMQTNQPSLLEVDLLTDTDDEGGRACGGIMSVYLEPLRIEHPG